MGLNKLTKILLSTQVDEIYFSVGDNERETCVLAADELVNGVGLSRLIVSGIHFTEMDDGRVIAVVILNPYFPKGYSDEWWEEGRNAYEQLKENLKEGFVIYGNEED